MVAFARVNDADYRVETTSRLAQWRVDNFGFSYRKSDPFGGESCSIWSEELTLKSTISTALTSLGKMLSESIHTDITICASNGTIEAHRAVLAARSPVFHSMFSHDLKEKEMSAINISDMTIEACQAFLSYIYTNIEHQDFIKHRLDLLRAADKYDVLDLQEACEESLMEDIDTKNVLERLQSASMYRLPKLKVCCIHYLVKFGKIYDIREEFNAFIQSGDRDLIGDVVNEILSVWKGYVWVVKLVVDEKVVDWFGDKGEISKGCNASFVMLILKVTDPIGLGDYRPISLIESYYKIIAKLIAERIIKLLGMLLVKKQKGSIFKVDFEKAYDSIEWGFLLEIMRKMRFGSKWSKWVDSCLKSTSILVLVYGLPTEEFLMEMTKNIFKGVVVGENEVMVSRLQYADDNERNKIGILKC
uniref:BTB domain-containing protein n=1 Tax=Tanacetum cinerariifolium TaxID=118510 RepID=A0A6L2JE48_TANCI|nr:hypothetical protein [Tanacetum cinerariifolium]